MDGPKSNRRDAPVWKRFLAGAIDLLPLAMFLALNEWSRTHTGLALRLGSKIVLWTTLFWILLRDSLSGYSPGKALLGLRALDRRTGDPAGVPDSVLRNLPLVPVVFAPLLGVYGPLFVAAVLVVHGLVIVSSRRALTDSAGGTEVVEE